jgi:hypothetical protein
MQFHDIVSVFRLHQSLKSQWHRSFRSAGSNPFHKNLKHCSICPDTPACSNLVATLELYFILTTSHSDLERALSNALVKNYISKPLIQNKGLKVEINCETNRISKHEVRYFL